MKNNLNHQDHLDEGAEKLNQSPDHNQQQPEGVSHKEQLEHDANKERGTEKARKQFEHIETKESTQEELENFKKTHNPVNQTKKEAKIITMRPENKNSTAPVYSSAEEGKKQAAHVVKIQIHNMQSFFGRKKAA